MEGMTLRLAHLLTPIAVLMLAACSRQHKASSEKPPSIKEVLARAQAMVKPEPGLYATTSTLTDFDLPGASSQDAQRMRRMMGGIKPQERKACVTEQDSQEGFAPVIRSMQKGACKIGQFDADQTHLHAQMHCTAADGSRSDVDITGTGGATQSHVVLAVVQKGDAIPGGSMHMTFTIDSHRIGACPAK